LDHTEIFIGFEGFVTKVKQRVFPNQVDGALFRLNVLWPKFCLFIDDFKLLF